MINKIRFEIAGFGFLLLMVLFLVFLPTTSSFQSAQKELSFAILLDLIITIPFIYYLIIRKTAIPKFTVIYALFFGILVAGFIIPIEHQTLLSKVKLIGIPILEISLVSLLIYKAISLRKSIKNSKINNLDFYDNVVMACHEVFPGRVGQFLATEIAMFYYLFSFKKNKEIHKNEYTYSKKSGIKEVIGVFLFLLIIETAAVHLLVGQWNTTIAWILSILGLYTGLQIIAIVRSMDKRLIKIDVDHSALKLNYGFACFTEIPFDMIERIKKGRVGIKEKNNVNLSIFEILETPNMHIKVKELKTLHKFYGLKKTYNSISFYVDDKDAFLSNLEQLIEAKEN